MAERFSFTDALIARALQKTAAAMVRHNIDPIAEKPKEIILAVIGEITETLRPNGFSFRKSGPELKRTAGDLTFHIRFQSDRNNISGHRCALS